MAKRSNRVINIHPNEAVITAFPYEPQSSLLDFLKGEPRVLGVSQLPALVLLRKLKKKSFFQVCLQHLLQEGG